MKNTLKILLSAAILFTASLAFAQSPPVWATYAIGGTDSGATNCWAIISAHSKNAGAPVITYLNVTSDKAGSVVQFYNCGAPLGIKATNSTTTIFVESTNGMAPHSFLVVQHTQSDTYELLEVSSFVNSTNLVVYHAPATTTIPSDKVYLQATTGVGSGTIPVGNTNVSLLGTGIMAGFPGRPYAMQLDSTSAGQVNAVSAIFYP